MRAESRADDRADGSGSANFSEDMSDQAEKVVRRFTGAKSDLFDKKAISESLANAGVQSRLGIVPSPSGMRLALSLASIDGLLGNAVSCSPKNRTLTITLSRGLGP